jgi:hypothetical protein
MNTDENPIEAEIVIEYEDGLQKVIRKWKEPKTSVQKRETAHYDRFKRADEKTNEAIQALHGLDAKRERAKRHRHPEAAKTKGKQAARQTAALNTR